MHPKYIHFSPSPQISLLPGALLDGVPVRNRLQGPFLKLAWLDVHAGASRLNATLGGRTNWIGACTFRFIFCASSVRRLCFVDRDKFFWEERWVSKQESCRYEGKTRRMYYVYLLALMLWYRSPAMLLSSAGWGFCRRCSACSLSA